MMSQSKSKSTSAYQLVFLLACATSASAFAPTSTSNIIYPSTSSTSSILSSSPSLQLQQQQHQHQLSQYIETNTALFSSPDEESEALAPTTFREAEIMGLRLMQEDQHEEALKVFQNGLKLPGSRKDIIRTKTLSGPSPVGGSSGGTEGRLVETLDEFESQAAYYNIACAFARLDKVSDSCKSLERAFNVGFDNYETVRADPDLEAVHGTDEFEALMEKYNPKKGFFGFFK